MSLAPHEIKHSCLYLEQCEGWHIDAPRISYYYILHACQTFSKITAFKQQNIQETCFVHACCAGNSQNDSRSTGNFEEGSDAWRWSLQYPDTSRPRLTKKLIGFARAIGDIALVGTLWYLHCVMEKSLLVFAHQLVSTNVVRPAVDCLNVAG